MRQLIATMAVLISTLTLGAGDDGAAGNWKLVLLEDGQFANLWLVRLNHKDAKWTGEAEGLKGVPDTKLNDLKVTGDLVQFELAIRNGPKFQFEGKAPRAGAKKILGSIAREGRPIPAFLEATTAKNSFELDRELVTRSPNDPRVFATVVDLVKQAKENKVELKELQEWVDAALRAVEGYGPRLQLDFSMRLMETLSGQKDYSALTTRVAEKVDALFDPKAPPAAQLQFLTTLGQALAKTATPARLKDLEERIDKLEDAAFADYNKTALDFKPTRFAGRKGKSDRAVLVELFTGAMCPPCVAADLGFDGLEKAFPSSDVVLLQYHLHIPGPDALSNDDTQKRADYYGRTLRGTPMIYFNGKPDKNVQGGGERGDAEEKYKEYREVVEPMLEKPAGAKLAAKAVRKGDKVTIQATVKGLEKPGETTRLRLVLVEDWVRYKSRNGMLYHHRVVRALPGGAAGFALTKNDHEQAVTVDLNDLRAGLNKYLDDFAKNETPFPDSQRPMRFRNLHVVALVQEDMSNDVLQAVDVAVTEE